MRTPVTIAPAPGEIGAPIRATRSRLGEVEERLHVLAGSVDLWLGETRLRLLAGSSVILPRAIAHGFNSVAANTRVVLEQG